MSAYLKDLTERFAWTIAEAGVGFAIVEAADIPGGYAVPIAGFLMVLKGTIGRHTGTVNTAALGGGL